VDSAAVAAQQAEAKRKAEAEAKKRQIEEEKAAAEVEEANQGFGILKKYFIDGGWVFMSLVLT